MLNCVVAFVPLNGCARTTDMDVLQYYMGR